MIYQKLYYLNKNSESIFLCSVNDQSNLISRLYLSLFIFDNEIFISWRIDVILFKCAIIYDETVWI
jgi:hypothetical protein